MSLNVVLFEPEIPPNTGNIARTCVATNTKLHLIHPLGFDIDIKAARRAGMDYWEYVDVYNYDSLDELFSKYPAASFYFIETGGNKTYADVDYSNVDENIFFVFGKESKGLPKDLLAKNQNRILTVPMGDKVRSLNLSNTVAILVYEALRQQDYQGLNEVEVRKGEDF
jgi:tRNA (cytidine/uridine-2'-O-)-methyltransferase